MEEELTTTQEQEIVESKFTGTVGSYIALYIINSLLCMITLGIYVPWAVCKVYRWQIDHKIVDGKKMSFEGEGGSLFGQYIKWMLLSIITLGIYGLFIPVKLEAWKTERTHFVA